MVNMHQCFYFATLMFLGILTAQILATIQVYLSNIDLYYSYEAIKSAGYLLVPNQKIIQSLPSLGPAFLGGMFFTLTVGAWLSFVTSAAVWIRKRFFPGNRFVAVLVCLLWGLCLVAANKDGFCPMVTSYFLAIPLTVIVAMLRWMPPKSDIGWRSLIIYVLPFVLMACLWTSRLDNYLFLDIRDRLLLSNPIGKKITDFYYNYNLYPAAVFKPLNQKILKTYNFEGISGVSFSGSIERELLKYDYLLVDGIRKPDLMISGKADSLVFKNRNKLILHTTFKEFISDPTHILNQFSVRSDQYRFFRWFTFFSLLFGLPILLYVWVHALFCFITNFFLDMRKSVAASSILCVLIGTALFFPLIRFNGEKIDSGNLPHSLESTQWHTRVEALKFIEKKKIEIREFAAYQSIRSSSRAAEVYWFVKTLGSSRHHETYKDLLTFLDFPDPNVVRMAFYALGQRGKREAVSIILKRIETSDSWYNQWYAYRALKALGWKQTKSN